MATERRDVQTSPSVHRPAISTHYSGWRQASTPWCRARTADPPLSCRRLRKTTIDDDAGSGLPPGSRLTRAAPQYADAPDAYDATLENVTDALGLHQIHKVASRLGFGRAVSGPRRSHRHPRGSQPRPHAFDRLRSWPATSCGRAFPGRGSRNRHTIELHEQREPDRSRINGDHRSG